jgi:hypothetical protein
MHNSPHEQVNVTMAPFQILLNNCLQIVIRFWKDVHNDISYVFVQLSFKDSSPIFFN